MAEEAARAAYEAAHGYLNLELDLETGKRSSRQVAIREWVCRLTGAESATAVNNNAAATVIVLRALCQGKEVIVSRGQLIEIGVRKGRESRKGLTGEHLKIGICGEHGGDPASVAFCHEIGLDYVSCSPFRVPIARLAAAQAALGKGAVSTA